MRRLFLITLMICLALNVLPVFALSEGAYQFESDPGFSYTGTWTSGSLAGMSVQSTTVNGSSVSFVATGTSIVIYRLMRTGITSTMDVCIAGLCQSVSNATSGSTDFVYPVIFSLPSGTSSVIITKTGGTVINLDYILILSSASSTFPTPVPTATAIPTSTPASTTTPQPTPTPQPTSTPISAVWAIDPAKRYDSLNGQITAMSYEASAADVHIGTLLWVQIVSIWGMFVFGFFMWWYRKWWR